MALTNAEKQRRWRERNVVTLSARESDIAEDLFFKLGPDRARKVSAALAKRLRNLKADCPVCKGTGLTPKFDIYGPCGGKETSEPLRMNCDCSQKMIDWHAEAVRVGNEKQQCNIPQPVLHPKGACQKCGGSGTYGLKAWRDCSDKSPGYVTPAFPCPDCKPDEYFIAVGGELRNQGKYVEALKAALDRLDYWAAGDTLIAWGVSAREVKDACLKARFRVSMKFAGELLRTAQAFPPGARKVGWGHCLAVGSQEELEKILNCKDDDEEGLRNQLTCSEQACEVT